MKWPAHAWLGQAVRGAANVTDALLGQRLQILMFHRVLAQPDPLFPGEMYAERFDCLMGVVAKAFSVLTLGQALTLMQQQQLPRRALVITFDDGYADNAEVALPLLQRHGLVATFFVSTGFLDGGRMFNDTVIEAIRAAPVGRLDLSEFGLGVRQLATIGDRRQAIENLLPRVKYLSLGQRENVLKQLLGLVGQPSLPLHLMMRSEQVVELHRLGMEIGGHTVHHPILTEISDTDAEAEIDAGRQRLQSLTGAPVEVFAYPNGGPGRDYDARHVAIVRKLGFRGAVSTAPGVATARADVFQLPRFTPWDLQPHRWLMRLLWQRTRNANIARAPLAT